LECRQRMRTDIINEVQQGSGRDSCAMICGQEHLDVCIFKIRIAIDNRGKSKGIRAYCLVIKLYKTIILLGITSHKKGQHDLTDGARNMLKKLCDGVAIDIEKEEG